MNPLKPQYAVRFFERLSEPTTLGELVSDLALVAHRLGASPGDPQLEAFVEQYCDSQQPATRADLESCRVLVAGYVHMRVVELSEALHASRAAALRLAA